MTDEELIQEELAPPSEADPVPASEAEPDPAPAPESEPDPAPTPVEVISVDELLERLAQAMPEEPDEKPPAEDEPQADDAAGVAEETVEQVQLREIAARLDVLDGHVTEVDGTLALIESRLDHPLLTTSFEDYTVSEGLLLLLLLFAFAKVCMNMVKGAFSWLR